MDAELISEQEFLREYDERCANIRKMICQNFAQGMAIEAGWTMELVVLSTWERGQSQSIKLKLNSN